MRNNNGACRCAPELLLRLSGWCPDLAAVQVVPVARRAENRQAPGRAMYRCSTVVVVGEKKTLNKRLFCFTDRNAR